MSAFAVVYERSNTPVEAGVLERVMARLGHRGPDGCDTRYAGPVALGHWHFWTVPEEVGERQPLQLPGLPFTIVLDGRLDNRPELIAELSLPPAEAAALSDAALMLHACDRWGQACFEHFIGPYALVIFDERRRELLCARDALGDRTLYYSFMGTRLVVASEPWAVAGVDDSGFELNETAVAYYFDMKTSEDGQSLFKNVTELLPAHAMAVDASSQRTWRTWQPDPSVQVRRNSDAEYAGEFRLLLEQSIRCRLRSTTPVGVLMSGGLDSTSVACLAARMLAPQPLTTLSYVFDELPDCDERQYIQAVKERCGLRSIQIPCDDAWPYKDWQSWPYDPNLPEGNPYRLLKQRAYQRAHMEGLRLLLTGGSGDELYDTGVDWLADLVLEGRFLKAGRELSRQIQSAGLRWTLQAGFLQRLARRLLDLFPGGRHLHFRPAVSGWLTDYSTGLLSKVPAGLDPFTAAHVNLLGLRAATSISAEIFNASRHALELRHPYRDRRLVAFVLALPGYQLYYHRYKHVLRNALQGILPESIRTRTHPTSLEQLFFRGLEREETVLQAGLRDSQAGWRRFVRPDWLVNHSDLPARSNRDIMNVIVPWLCMSYEIWRSRHSSQ